MLSDRDKIVTALIQRGAMLLAHRTTKDEVRYMLPGSAANVFVGAKGYVRMQPAGHLSSPAPGLHAMLLNEYAIYMQQQAKRIPSRPALQNASS